MPELRPLTPALAAVARRDLNEDPAQIESHLDVIKGWLAECGATADRSDDEQLLVAFLRGCKFSLEKVKKKLLLFYQIRGELTEIVQNRDPCDERLLQVIRLGVSIPLPETVLPTDPKIFLIRVGRFDLSVCNFADVMKVGTLINDIVMRDDDQMVVCGMQLIIDMDRVTASHLFQFELELLRKVAELNQDASPLRMQGIHILNPPPGLQTALSMFNGLLSEKNKHKRIYSHGRDLNSLYKHFPPSVLPKEYGGDLQSIDFYLEQWEQTLKQNRTYLLEMATMRVKQTSATLATSANSNGNFGTQGSFRRLEID